MLLFEDGSRRSTGRDTLLGIGQALRLGVLGRLTMSRLRAPIITARTSNGNKRKDRTQDDGNQDGHGDGDLPV